MGSNPRCPGRLSLQQGHPRYLSTQAPSPSLSGPRPPPSANRPELVSPLLSNLQNEITPANLRRRQAAKRPDGLVVQICDFAAFTGLRSTVLAALDVEVHPEVIIDALPVRFREAGLLLVIPVSKVVSLAPKTSLAGENKRENRYRMRRTNQES